MKRAPSIFTANTRWFDPDHTCLFTLMTKPTKPKQPSKQTPTDTHWELKTIQHHRYIIALDKYFGFQEMTGPVQESEQGGTYDFDFMVWPSWHHVKMFTKLDKPEIAKFSGYPKPERNTFILDCDQMASAVTGKLEKGVPRCILSPEVFEAAKTLNAYLFYDRRIWSSHMATNVWEPLPSIEDRILAERDWNLTRPAPVTIHSIKPKPTV